MLKQLLESKIDKYIANQAGLTAMDVACQSNNRENISSLRHGLIPWVSKDRYKCDNQIVKYATKASSIIFHDMDKISGDDRNAMLVILGLLLTATFQASLSPPGGLWQGDPSSNSRRVGGEYGSPGTSVMNPGQLFKFYLRF
ncbi:hypothetical protein V6N12_008159 [Hibiscus sabdariffa]|uniref:PGG domain-containing protein n=1 Tax=Hibiscus sabdariffa TaxID=183260 RepID=A0ABR2BT40_9ROSI